MTDTKEAPKHVWWWHIDTHARRKNPYVADFCVWSEAWHRNDDFWREKSRILGQHRSALTGHLEPECLVFENADLRRHLPFADLFEGLSSAVIVSGAMIDILRQHDLGASSILELPVFEGKRPEKGSGYTCSFIPDQSRPFPG